MKYKIDHTKTGLANFQDILQKTYRVRVFNGGFSEPIQTIPDIVNLEDLSTDANAAVTLTNSDPYNSSLDDGIIGPMTVKFNQIDLSKCNFGFSNTEERTLFIPNYYWGQQVDNQQITKAIVNEINMPWDGGSFWRYDNITLDKPLIQNSRFFQYRIVTVKVEQENLTSITHQGEFSFPMVATPVDLDFPVITDMLEPRPIAYRMPRVPGHYGRQIATKPARPVYYRVYTDELVGMGAMDPLFYSMPDSVQAALTGPNPLISASEYLLKTQAQQIAYADSLASLNFASVKNVQIINTPGFGRIVTFAGAGTSYWNDRNNASKFYTDTEGKIAAKYNLEPINGSDNKYAYAEFVKFLPIKKSLENSTAEIVYLEIQPTVIGDLGQNVGMVITADSSMNLYSINRFLDNPDEYSGEGTIFYEKENNIPIKFGRARTQIALTPEEPLPVGTTIALIKLVIRLYSLTPSSDVNTLNIPITPAGTTGLHGLTVAVHHRYTTDGLLPDEMPTQKDVFTITLAPVR